MALSLVIRESDARHGDLQDLLLLRERPKAVFVAVVCLSTSLFDQRLEAAAGLHLVVVVLEERYALVLREPLELLRHLWCGLTAGIERRRTPPLHLRGRSEPGSPGDLGVVELDQTRVVLVTVEEAEFLPFESASVSIEQTCRHRCEVRVIDLESLVLDRHDSRRDSWSLAQAILRGKVGLRVAILDDLRDFADFDWQLPERDLADLFNRLGNIRLQLR